MAPMTVTSPAVEATRQQVPCVNSATVGTGLLSQSSALDLSIASSSLLASNADGDPSPALKHRLKHITAKFPNPKADLDPSLRLSATHACSWKFTRYESSKWEREWLDALDSRVPNPCAAMAASDFIERGRRLLQRNMQLIDSYVACRACQDMVQSDKEMSVTADRLYAKVSIESLFCIIVFTAFGLYRCVFVMCVCVCVFVCVCFGILRSTEMYPRPEQVDDELYSKMHYEAECYDQKTHTFARRTDVKAFQYIEPVRARRAPCVCVGVCVCVCVFVCVHTCHCGNFEDALDAVHVDSFDLVRYVPTCAVGGHLA
jgi:hypothetical protein